VICSARAAFAVAMAVRPGIFVFACGVLRRFTETNL
jgi:hypothetical protein